MAQTGYTPISLYYSSTASATPTAGNLVAGELAINTADGKLFYKDSAGVVQVIGTKGGVGSSTTTQVLYNSSGLVVGSANMTFNGTTLTLANDASISGLTVGKGGGAVSTAVVLGNGALAATNSGNYNIAIGSVALAANTSGTYNTGVGGYSLNGNTTGNYNSAFGTSALQTNSTGANNTAVGVQSLLNNTTASNNTAVGYQAAYSNVTGTQVTAVGYQALKASTGNYNSAFGSASQINTTTGTANTSVGISSMLANTTGAYNVAVGADALVSNTTASNNTAVGYQAGYTNTTGTLNSYFGWSAGRVDTGSYNTYLGSGAGYYMTSGSKNTLLGGYNGNQGGLDIRTASNYIVLSDGDGNPRAYWDNAGAYQQLTNWNSYYIAKFYNTNNTSGNGTIFSVLGSNNNNTNSYHFVGMTNNIDVVYIRGNGNIVNVNNSYGSLSDIKLKENIVDASPKLNDLMQVKVRNYNFKGNPNQKQLGVIAQELETIFPSMVDESFDRDAEGKETTESTKSVKYSVFVPMLIKAIQELNAKVDSLKQQLGK